MSRELFRSYHFFSVAFKWVVPEIDDAKAQRLRNDYRSGVHELLAPDIFPAEVGNARLTAERRGRIAQYAPLLLDVLTTCPLLHATLPLLPRVSTIVALARVTIYDSLYVALADREQCEFVTADDKIVRNLQVHFPFILPLSSFP